MKALTSALSIIVLLTSPACWSVDTGPGFERVRELSQPRVDADLSWARTEEDVSRIRRESERRLDHGLTRTDAARIAVLNNPALQAQWARIGIAASDVVESALPTNPTLDVNWASPRRTGDSAIGLVAWLSDFWTIPRRHATAESAARLVQYDVALQIMVTAQAAAGAWDRAVASREELRLARALLEVRRREHARRGIRHAHGIDDDRTVRRSEQAVALQETAVLEAEQRLTESESELDRALGVEGAAASIRPDETLSALEETVEGSTPTLEDAIAFGLTERLDVAMSEADIERLAHAHGLEESLVWNAVGVGVGREGLLKETKGDEDSLGLILSIDLPVFDRNQAGIARAEFELEAAVQLLAATRQRAVQEIIDRHRGLERARDRLQRVEQSLVPAADAEREYAREWNRRMQVNAVDLFESEAAFIEALAEASRATLAANDAWRALRMALLGGSAGLM